MRFFAAFLCPALCCLSAHFLGAKPAGADESESWYRPHRIFPSDPYGANEYHAEKVRPAQRETFWDALGLPRSLDDDSLIDERLEAAERLRRLGERTGSERLIDAARRIETRAHEQAHAPQEWRDQQEYEQQRRAEQAYEQQRRREEQQYQEQLRRQEQAYEQQRRREEQYEQQQRLNEQPRQARRWWRGPRQAAPQPTVQREPTVALSPAEQRLSDQFDMAARLRELAQRNGNQRLHEAADELEQSALEEYEKSLERPRSQAKETPK